MSTTTEPKTSTVGAYEAKTKLPELLRRVEAGETITITRNGTVVAMLRPPVAKSAAEAWRDLRARADAFRKALVARRGGQGLTLDEIRGGVEEGRR